MRLGIVQLEPSLPCCFAMRKLPTHHCDAIAAMCPTSRSLESPPRSASVQHSLGELERLGIAALGHPIHPQPGENRKQRLATVQ